MTEKEQSPIRAALDAGDFFGAQKLLAEVSAPPSAELLELRAQAAYGAGDLEDTLAAYGELYRLHLEDDRPFAAVMVGMYLMMDTGLMATVRAWLSRPQGRLLPGTRAIFAPASPPQKWPGAAWR